MILQRSLALAGIGYSVMQYDNTRQNIQRAAGLPFTFMRFVPFCGYIKFRSNIHYR
jgi:hypothetical protein